MSRERNSLESAFAPAATRGSSLGGLLPPKRRRDADDPNPAVALVPAPEPDIEPIPEQAAPSIPADRPFLEQVAEPTPVKPVKAERTAKTANAPKQKVKASETVPGATRNIGVYLPPELLEQVKETARAKRTTYAELLVDAFDVLDDVSIAEEFQLASVTTASRMPRRAKLPRGTAGIQRQLRLDDEQIAWLDQKVTDLGAPSRSALVTAVYAKFVALDRQQQK